MIALQQIDGQEEVCDFVKQLYKVPEDTPINIGRLHRIQSDTDGCILTYRGKLLGPKREFSYIDIFQFIASAKPDNLQLTDICKYGCPEECIVVDDSYTGIVSNMPVHVIAYNVLCRKENGSLALVYDRA